MQTIDLHTDVLNKLAGLSDNGQTPSVNAQSLKAGNVTHSCFALFCGRNPEAEVQKQSVLKQAEIFKQLGGKMGACALHSALEGLDYASPEFLQQIIADVSPVYATLTWNHTAGICGSCIEDFPLTKWGKLILRMLEQKNVRPDLSHAGQKAFFSVFDNAEQPIVTHACVCAVTPHRRNLTDEQIKLIIKRDTLFGMTFYSDFNGGTLESIVKHILHVLDMGGQDVLALGSDFDGCSRLPKGLEGPEGFPLLYNALLENGVSRQIADKIFYKNAVKKLGF